MCAFQPEFCLWSELGFDFSVRGFWVAVDAEGVSDFVEERYFD